MKTGPTATMQRAIGQPAIFSNPAATVWATDWLPAVKGAPEPLAQPKPQPLARVGMANPARVAASPSGSRHNAGTSTRRQAAAGSVSATATPNRQIGTINRPIGCLIAMPNPTSPQPNSQARGRRAANQTPRTPRAVAQESLCIPPMKCTKASGLSKPNHTARRGSPPTARAIPGRQAPIASIAINPDNRIGKDLAYLQRSLATAANAAVRTAVHAA